MLATIALMQLGVLVALAVQASRQSTTTEPTPALSTALASLALNLENLESSALASISTVPDMETLPQHWYSQGSSTMSMQSGRSSTYEPWAVVRTRSYSITQPGVPPSTALTTSSPPTSITPSPLPHLPSDPTPPHSPSQNPRFVA
jgi:hypothetical protein